MFVTCPIFDLYPPNSGPSAAQTPSLRNMPTSSADPPVGDTPAGVAGRGQLAGIRPAHTNASQECHRTRRPRQGSRHSRSWPMRSPLRAAFVPPPIAYIPVPPTSDRDSPSRDRISRSCPRPGRSVPHPILRLWGGSIESRHPLPDGLPTQKRTG